jgi:hypothetical protein
MAGSVEKRPYEIWKKRASNNPAMILNGFVISWKNQLIGSGTQLSGSETRTSGLKRKISGKYPVS